MGCEEWGMKKMAEKQRVRIKFRFRLGKREWQLLTKGSDRKSVV